MIIVLTITYINIETVINYFLFLSSLNVNNK